MRTLFLSAVLSLLAGAAAAQSWQSVYSVGTRAGEVTSCNAGIRYPGAAFATRIYGPEMDIYVRNAGVRLTPGRDLGFASLRFDGASGPRTVNMRAYSYPDADPGSNLTSAIVLIPAARSYQGVLGLLKSSDFATLSYSDGRVLTVGLNGSGRAISTAESCWSRYATGPVGGREVLIARGRF